MKKLILLFVVGMFLISFTSAFEFDNVKEYDPINKEVTIKNCDFWLIICLNVGDEIGKAKLNTPQNVAVARGYQKVAEFNIEAFEDYDDVVKNFKFTDMKTGKEINRDIDIKFKTTKNITVPDYKEVCNTLGNGTTQCYKDKIGEHNESVEAWGKKESYNLKENESITIGIFTEVKKGDYIDWKPTIYGVEIDEWATWTESLSVGILTYYKMELEANDVLSSVNETLNATATDITRGVTGYINNGFEFGGSTSQFDTNANLFGNQETRTISCWVNHSAGATGYEAIYVTQNTTESFNFLIDVNDKLAFRYRKNGAYNILTSPGTVTDNEWVHVAVTFNLSTRNVTLYINGDDEGSVLAISAGSWGHATEFANGVWGSQTNNFWFNGTMDECAVWDRVLTPAEISEVNLSTTGFFTDSNLSTTLNSPVDTYNSTTNDITFNCSALVTGGTGLENLTNMSLYTNESGTWEAKNTTNITDGRSSTQTWDRNIADGNYIWTCESCIPGINNCSFADANRTLNIDTSFPQIVIATPTSLLDYNFISGDETLNVTFTDDDLQSCWYNYNGTNITIAGCVTGVSNQTTFVLIEDDFNMTIYANDTSGNLNSTFIDWEYKILETNRTFNSSSFETQSESFNIEFEANTSLTSVALIYNGTAHTTTLANNQSTRIINIPFINGNKSLFWNFTYGSEIISSYTSNQSINGLTLGVCNTTLTVPYINYTFADEGNLSVINGTIPTSNFTYYFENESLSKELIFINVTENPSFAFCSSASNHSLNIDVRLQYQSTGYPQRVHDPDIEIFTNSTTNTTLYLLATASGQYVTFQVVSSAEQPLENVFINATRLIGGVTTLIDSGFTSAAGTLTLWLNPDFEYTFNFALSGYDTYESTFAPTLTSYSITLGGGIIISRSDYTRGISYKINPSTSSTLNYNTFYNFTFELSSSFWDVEQFGFNLIDEDNDTVGYSNLSTNGGITYLNYNIINNSIIYMDYWWIIDGNRTSDPTFWGAWNNVSTEWSITHFFSDVNIYMDSGLFGLDDFGIAVILFLFIFTFVGIMSYKYGLQSPGAILLLTGGLIIFLDVGVGMFDNIVPGVDNFISIVVCIILLSILIKEAIK